MAEVFTVAIPSQEKVYKLGTIHSAINTFPYLLKKEGAFQEFVLYGDQTHSFLEDRYEYNMGFEKVNYDFTPIEELEWINQNAYTESEFRAVFAQFGGKKVMKANKFDFFEM